MHYREASLAAGENATELQRRIWSCHRRISDRKFIRQLLLHTMQRQFTTGENSKNMLLPELLENFDLEFDRILLGRSDNSLASLCDGEYDFDRKRRELSGMIQEYCANLVNGDWQYLLEISPEKRRTLPKVLSLNINELRCFASPLCIFSDLGKMYIVELRGGEFAGFESETAVIHRFYAMNHCGREPDMVESLILDYENGKLRRFDEKFDCSEGIRKIAEEAALWTELAKMSLTDLRPDDPANCSVCVFKDICKTL